MRGSCRREERGIVEQMAGSTAPDNYLQRCLAEYNELCRLKYGNGFDLEAVEQKVRHLRRRTALTFEDLRYFESPEHWWFRRFWVFPPQDRLASALENRQFDFWNLEPANEKSLIRDLLYAFKTIELVSIILRFIRPDLYGIFSSPIQHILEIRRGREPVETYINFLSDLRIIGDHYGFERVADVDMGLWVLHERCFGTSRDAAVEKAFREDTFLQRIRARNLVAPLEGFSTAELSQMLEETRPELAAVLACHSFEILIRELGEKYGVAPVGSWMPLEQVIEGLPHYGGITPIRKALWKRYKDIRNELFHEGKQPSPRERSQLIEEIVRIEREEKGQAAVGAPPAK